MTSLSVKDPSFYLANLDPSCMYREMPFMFPCDPESKKNSPVNSESLIRGVIDLVFLRRDKYYIVDWKSNWLGQRREDYSHDAMEQAMSENGYFLQASIYTEALGRYLKIVDPRPFKDCFGGIFYLFMRGMSPDQRTGIHHFIPKPFHGKMAW